MKANCKVGLKSLRTLQLVLGTDHDYTLFLIICNLNLIHTSSGLYAHTIIVESQIISKVLQLHLATFTRWTRIHHGIRGTRSMPPFAIVSGLLALHFASVFPYQWIKKGAKNIWWKRENGERCQSNSLAVNDHFERIGEELRKAEQWGFSERKSHEVDLNFFGITFETVFTRGRLAWGAVFKAGTSNLNYMDISGSRSLGRKFLIRRRMKTWKQGGYRAAREEGRSERCNVCLTRTAVTHLESASLPPSTKLHVKSNRSLHLVGARSDWAKISRNTRLVERRWRQFTSRNLFHNRYFKDWSRFLTNYSSSAPPRQTSRKSSLKGSQTSLRTSEIKSNFKGPLRVAYGYTDGRPRQSFHLGLLSANLKQATETILMEFEARLHYTIMFHGCWASVLYLVHTVQCIRYQAFGSECFEEHLPISGFSAETRYPDIAKGGQIGRYSNQVYTFPKQ